MYLYCVFFVYPGMEERLNRMSEFKQMNQIKSINLKLHWNITSSLVLLSHTLTDMEDHIKVIQCIWEYLYRPICKSGL